MRTEHAQTHKLPLHAAQTRQITQIAWFDWGMAVCSAWFLGGLFLDGWAHSHGRVDNSFFTPWHAVFYSGFGAVALFLAAAVARGILAGQSWRRAIPAGYEYAAVGIPIFALGGVGDMIWHSVFGIENGLDALLSPTHLFLAAGMALILSAPARAAWLRAEQQEQRTPIGVPALVALIFTHGLTSFMTQYGHPYVYLLARTGYRDTEQALGVLAMMLQAAVLVGFVLFALRRWAMPFGALTLWLAANAAFMSVIEDRYWLITVALGAGLLADVIFWLLKPSPQRMWALRLAAALLPMTLNLAYFLTLLQIDRIAWSIHLWAGTVVLVGFLGFGMSMLLCPRELQRKKP
jgi:hypothetical protein